MGPKGPTNPELYCRVTWEGCWAPSWLGVHLGLSYWDGQSTREKPPYLLPGRLRSGFQCPGNKCPKEFEVFPIEYSALQLCLALSVQNKARDLLQGGESQSPSNMELGRRSKEIIASSFSSHPNLFEHWPSLLHFQFQNYPVLAFLKPLEVSVIFLGMILSFSHCGIC